MGAVGVVSKGRIEGLLGVMESEGISILWKGRGFRCYILFLEGFGVGIVVYIFCSGRVRVY